MGYPYRKEEVENSFHLMPDIVLRTLIMYRLMPHCANLMYLNVRFGEKLRRGSKKIKHFFEACLFFELADYGHDASIACLNRLRRCKSFSMDNVSLGAFLYL